MNVILGSSKNRKRIHNKTVEFELPEFVIVEFPEFKGYIFHLNIPYFDDSMRNGIYRSIHTGDGVNMYLSINGFFDKRLENVLKFWRKKILEYGVCLATVSDIKVEITNKKFMIGWSYMTSPMVFSNSPIFISDIKNCEKNMIFYYGKIYCWGCAVQIE